jgi:hypothetical protein
MKKIILLSIFLFTLLISSRGQILYTDFIPDIYITNQPQGTIDSAVIDIDQDGSKDFAAYCETFFNFVHQGCCWNTNNRIEINPSLISFAFDNSSSSQNTCGRIALDSNIWIDSSFYYPTIYTAAYLYRDGNIAQCGWSLDTTPKFYPFRKTANNDTLYGWIRIEAHPTFMIIYDAAINTISNTGLFTGQITGIYDHEYNNSINIFPTITTDKIQIINNSTNKEDIIIFNSLGQIIKKMEINSKEKYYIDFVPFGNGLYVVYQLSSNNRTKILKI